HLHAAVGTHFDDVQPLLEPLVHPVLAIELGRHAFDRAFDAKRLAATDAEEWFFLLDDPARFRGGAEIDLWFKADYFFGTRCLAQAALHAGIFGKAQHRTLRIVRQRAGRAGGNAG